MQLSQLHTQAKCMNKLSNLRGDPQICIAILDSDVDMTHPSLKDTALERILIPGLAPATNKSHGTYVASIIFSDDEDIRGIAPKCRGIYIPVYSEENNRLICDQDKLAEGIMLAAKAGAHIINISGGVITPDNSSSLRLSEAIRHCAANRIQVVAAVGNEGCDCLHVPASLPGVLAVGGLDELGEPYPFNNYGHIYRKQGLLVSLDGVKGAVPGLGTMHKAASSYAAPVAAGMLALLCSMQAGAKKQVDPLHLKELLLQTADQCPKSTAEECKRFLAGIVNPDAAYEQLKKENDQGRATPSGISEAPVRASFSATPQHNVRAVRPSENEIQGSPVYVLGEPGFQFISESVKRSLENDLGPSLNTADFLQAMLTAPDKGNMLHNLTDRLHYADAITWTFEVNGVPAYAIRPEGEYAKDIYRELIRFILIQLHESADLKHASRYTLSGKINGTVRLMNGMELPVVTPNPGGISGKSTRTLLNEVIPPLLASTTNTALLQQHQLKTNRLLGLVNRIYYTTAGNKGQDSRERAINYAISQALLARTVLHASYSQNLALRSVVAEPSPLTPPGAEYYDVILTFFNPLNQLGEADTLYSFTVDVTQAAPSLAGTVKTWNA